MIKKAKQIKGIPTVSVIICCYNEADVIAKTIESIVKQTYKPIEIIIGDNGSTDNSLDIIKKYKKDIKKIITYKCNNGSPGRVWNEGTKVSKGQILMFAGGSLVYGKDYINNLIKPILKGETIGTLHNEEKIANLENLWARGFCKERINKTGKGKIFSLIRKDAFFKYSSFDSSLGYADDQTIYRKHGIESIGIDADVWHHNPDTFKKTWRHDVWVGNSFRNPYKTILILPIFYLWACYKTLKHLKKDFYWKFIFFLPIFYSLRYLGYFIGAFKKIFKIPIK